MLHSTYTIYDLANNLIIQKQTDTILLDLKKAFDKEPHKRLFQAPLLWD